MSCKERRLLSARFQEAFDVISECLEFLGDPENVVNGENLTAAIYPEIHFLLIVLVDDEFFIGDVLSKCSEDPSRKSRTYVKLLSLIINRLSCEPGHVIEKWFVEDLMGTTLIDLLFKHLPYFTAEIISSTIEGKIFYPSYDQLCIKMCKLLSVIPEKSFCVLENCLVSNILNENLICSMLAADIWFFLILNTSEDLRIQHCKLLFKLAKISSGVEKRNIIIFLERVLPLLTQLQIEQLMAEFDPMKYPEVWNQSYNCEIENKLCISFLQSYDCRKSYPNILPLISSFISKSQSIDKQYREKLIFILLIALKHNIEENNDIASIPGLLNALSKQTDFLPQDIIPSLSYSLCYSNFQENDTFKYLFCYLCSLFIRSTTTGQQRALFECLIKCYSKRCSQYTSDLLNSHLLYLCNVYPNLDQMCPLINSRRDVRERLIEYIETKKKDALNPIMIDEKSSLIQKVFTFGSD